MYSQRIVQKRLDRLADRIRGSIDPGFTFKEYTEAEIDEWDARLVPLWDPTTLQLSRSLNPDEEAFIRHEINRCKVDFLYWCTRRAFIKTKKAELSRLHPNAVQRILLERIGTEEERCLSGQTGDGILMQVLKARQLGVSTISDIIICHRIFHYGNTTAMIAADADERTPNLYEMVVRCYDNLPWYLQPRSLDPKRDYRVKSKQIFFSDQDSLIRFGSGANKQGGSSGQEKGSLGTGMTLPLVHLSELALWANPLQIKDALLPSIPQNERTLAIFESTAKGRNNWWYDAWQQAIRGLGRMHPVFIPWYTDPETYTIPAPLDWTPNKRALQHAARVAETSARWVGHTVVLTRDQLYWWERTYEEYRSERILYKFFAEYTSDDQEAFQNTSHGVFPTEIISDLRNQAKNPIYVEIKPKAQMDRPRVGAQE